MDVSIAELLGSGLKLMFIGMGIVFFFLLLLVGVIQQTHGILRRLEHSTSTPQPASPDVHVAEEQEFVAVVAAAIHQYEQR